MATSSLYMPYSTQLIDGGTPEDSYKEERRFFTAVPPGQMIISKILQPLCLSITCKSFSRVIRKWHSNLHGTIASSCKKLLL